MITFLNVLLKFIVHKMKLRYFYKDVKTVKRRPLEYCFTLFLITGLLLLAVLFLSDLIMLPIKMKNELVGIIAILFTISGFSIVIALIAAEKEIIPSLPSMKLKSKLLSQKIKRRLKPLYLVKLLKIERSPWGYPLPSVGVFVAPSCSTGWVAIENSPLFNGFDPQQALTDLSGLLNTRSLRRFSFTSAELSKDSNFFKFYFEDVKTSQRLIVKNGLLSFISNDPHSLKLAKNLTWTVSGSTAHLAIVGHTRSGKSYFTARYLLPLMKLQGWIVRFYSVKNDIYVSRYDGEYMPEKIINSLEGWVKFMQDRNKKIREANKEKYSQMPSMPDVALVIDEIGSLNGAVSSDRKLKKRWETAIGQLTATGASAGIHIVALSQFGTKESFLPSTARANVSDAVIFLGLAADSPNDRQFLLPGFDIPHRRYKTGQGIARIVSAGQEWESPHFFETPLFKETESSA